VAVRLHAGNWDDMVHPLRSRALDFFVAETSLLTQEPDLDVVTLPVRHPIYFVARARHPLTRMAGEVRAADVGEWPFATPSRIPPRILEPLLLAHRKGSARSGTPRPFPAIECNGLEPLKRIIASSNMVTATILPCIADELERGSLRLLATEPWMHLQYGIVSLRGRPWTQAAEAMRDLVLEAEQSATELGERLRERHSPQRRTRRSSSRRDEGKRHD
jgi:hypothetical protein